MNASVFISDRIKFEFPRESLVQFFQQQANRLMQGACRYSGLSKDETKYMSRMEKEVKAYRRSGNKEHLLNVANYAYLESQQPENKKYHFDNTIRSVTR
jgi:hypothetical protein